VSRQTFRSEEYAEYKAGRSATPTEFEGQISLTQEILGALRIPFVQVEGYEADDVIATLTTMATAEGMDVLICSGDRDAFQLVTDQVTLLYPVRGCLRGLADDPGGRGGEVRRAAPSATATSPRSSASPATTCPASPGSGPRRRPSGWGMYADLDGVVAHVDQIGARRGRRCASTSTAVLRNRRLNQLVRDLELGVELEDLARSPGTASEVHEVFDALEFRVLRDRLFATFEAPEPEAESRGFDLDGKVLASGQVAGWLERHAPVGVAVGVHVVGTLGAGHRRRARAGAGHGTGRRHTSTLIGLDAEASGTRVLAGGPERPKAIHDGKGPMHRRWPRGG
jgi:DNA polymerase-1